MKRKIKNYLNSIEKTQYTNLDRLFELYLSGEIKKVLSKYSGVSIHPIVNKSNRTIQLEYNYNNIYCTVEFFEDKYSVTVYYAGVSIEDLDKLSIDYDYQDNFNLEELINEIDEIIINHPQLKDTTLILKKKKIYSLIASISLWLPITMFGGISLYSIITDSVVQLNYLWGIFLIVIPIIIWFIFDVKSNRIK